MSRKNQNASIFIRLRLWLCYLRSSENQIVRVGSSRKRDKPITIFVPTLCDWPSFSASPNDIKKLVFTRPVNLARGQSAVFTRSYSSSTLIKRGSTALTRAVSGEKQIYSGNLEILPGIGKPGKFFGKYEIFSGHWAKIWYYMLSNNIYTVICTQCMRCIRPISNVSN